MKHLFYSTCYPSPHLETELELALSLIEKGEDVYFLECNSSLNTCFVNPTHKSSICSACKSKLHRGLDLIGVNEAKRLSFREVNANCYDLLNGLNLKTISDLKQLEYKGVDLGLAVVSSMISNLRNHKFDVVRYRSLIQKYLKTGIYVYESMSNILDDIQPDFVYIFNGRFIESRPLMRLCEQRKITFFTHERGSDKERYLLIENETPHHLSRIIKEIDQIWEQATPEKIEIGTKFFNDRRQGINQSWVSFTEDQKKNYLPANFDTTKRNIAIFNTSMDEYESIPDFKNLIYADDNDGIRKLVQSFIEFPDFHFYLRVHPNLKGLSNYQMKEIKEMNFPNLTVIHPEEPIDSYKLMLATEKTVTFGSTVGIEALYFKKPSILLGRAFYENVDGLIKPTNHLETIEMIKAKIVVGDNTGAIKYGYWCSVFGEKFKYYQPDNLFKGRFLNKYLKSNLRSRVMMRLDRFYFDTFSQFNGF